MVRLANEPMPLGESYAHYLFPEAAAAHLQDDVRRKYGPVTVPDGHYFMMGDNRDRSADSRVLRQVGYVPATNLIGKGEFRFFSIKDNVAPWQLWQWPANVRWDRMFQTVYVPITHTPT